MNAKKDHYLPALSFHFLTPFYDPVVALTTREKAFKYELVKQANLQPKQTVLDLACGTATLTIALKKSGPEAEVYGLDGDSKILELAQQKVEKAELEIAFDEGLSFKMPYHNEKFDVVVSSLFFHHLTPENKLRTLHEIYRVIKPGGTLYIADWGLASNFLMKLASIPIQLLDGETTKDSFGGKLPGLIEKAGFMDVKETSGFNSAFGTIRLHRAQKL